MQKEFKIISGVVDDKGDFVRVRVSPTFQYITLKRTRIGNPEALFEKLPGQKPATPHEPQPVAENRPGILPDRSLSSSPAAASAPMMLLKSSKKSGRNWAHSIPINWMRDFPNTIADNLAPDAAAQFKKRLEDAGCTVEIK